MFTGSSQLGWVSQSLFLQLDGGAHNTHFAPEKCTSVCFLSFPRTWLFWNVLPDLSGRQSHLHYLSPLIFCRVVGGTGACPSITWARLSVTFTKQTGPHVNKVWMDAINANTQGWPVASQLLRHLCCKWKKTCQKTCSQEFLEWKLMFQSLPSHLHGASLVQKTVSSTVLSVTLHNECNVQCVCVCARVHACVSVCVSEQSVFKIKINIL